MSVTTDEQYLISTSSAKTDSSSVSSCGSRAHPWHLEAPLGQRINISILDFRVTPRDGASCLQYGYILDKANKKNVSICAKHDMGEVQSQREDAIFTSGVNNLDLVLFSGAANADNFNFLLKLTGVITSSLLSCVKLDTEKLR